MYKLFFWGGGGGHSNLFLDLLVTIRLMGMPLLYAIKSDSP